MTPAHPSAAAGPGPAPAGPGLALGTSPVALPADFLAQLTHELKNHVAAAQAASYLLRTQGRTVAGEREQKWLEAIQQAVAGLRGTLDQIDTLEQVITGVAEPGATVELVAWADRVVARSIKAAPAASVRMEVRALASGRWRFDTGLAGLALGGLVDNALKFGPPDSTAVVELRPGEDWLEIIVRDDGAGVPAAEAGRLFHPFFQGANARDRGGAGLGLTIAHAAVTRQGGTVSYLRPAGKGTEFHLRVPATRVEA